MQVSEDHIHVLHDAGAFVSDQPIHWSHSVSKVYVYAYSWYEIKRPNKLQ